MTIEIKGLDGWVEQVDLDLGEDHYLNWTWQRIKGEDATDERGSIGAIVYHRGPTSTGWCGGGIMFDVPHLREDHKTRGGHPAALWRLESIEPLTVSPSLLCSCGDHGFIRDGKWVRA